MQLLYDCFVDVAAQRGRGRTHATSLHRRAKRSDLSASCYEEAERSDLSRWLMEASCSEKYAPHLGSSSFITDATGYAVQHLQYLPFGETFVDQTPATNSYDSRYTFSAKEKDDETQYSYFGARYYDSDLSVWLSVDPMSDKYPHQSPYMYCSGNPVMLIDPTGESDKEFDDIYSIDTDGHVKLENETNDNYDVVYKKSDYDKGDLSNGQKVTNKGILPALEKCGREVKVPDVRDAETGEVTYDNFTLDEACSTNATEMISLFVFFSNASTNAEWRLHKEKSGDFNLSTFHSPSVSPGYQDLGFSDPKDIIWMIHSHPKAKPGGEVAGMDVDRVTCRNYSAYYVYTPQSGCVFKLPNSTNSSIRKGQSNNQVQYFLNLLK